MISHKLWLAAVATAVAVSVPAAPVFAAGSFPHKACPTGISLAKIQIPQKRLAATNHKTESAGTNTTAPNTGKTDSGIATDAPGKE